MTDPTSKMVAAFRTYGTKVFLLDVESREDVWPHWDQLVAEGRLTLDVEVLCQDGHTMWSGPVDDARGPWKRCPLCPDPYDIEAHMMVIARMTPAWVKELQAV